MSTQSRVGVDITARDLTAAAFNSIQYRLANLERGVNRARTFMQGLAGSLAIAGLASSLKATVDRMDQVGQAAQRIGIGTEALSRMQYAAKLSDLSLDGLTESVGKLNRNLVEISSGRPGQAGAALDSLSIKARTTDGHLKSTEAVMLEVADAFSTLKDGAGKTSLAMALFGKSGASMIPFLNGGAAAMRDASAEAERFGLVVSGQASWAANTFNDNVDRIKGALEGVAQRILVQTLPSVVELTENFLDFANSSTVVTDSITQIGEKLSWLSEWYYKADAASETMWARVLAAGKATNQVFSGDLQGAADTWSRAGQQVDAIWADAQKRIDMVGQSVNRAGKISLPTPAPQRTLDTFGAPAPKRIAPRQRDPLAADAKRLLEETRTPMEAYIDRQRELHKLLDKGYINQTVYNRALEEAKIDFVDASAALNTFTEVADKNAEMLDGISEALKNGLGQVFDNIISRSKSVKGAISDMVRSILSDVSRMFMTNALQQVFAGSHPLYGGGGGWGALLGGLFGGFRAGGGSVQAGRAYVVGEEHPELFVPGQSGTIVPDIPGAGGTTAITYAPSIVVQGNADDRAMRQALAEAQRNWKAQLPGLLRDAQRRGRMN